MRICLRQDNQSQRLKFPIALIATLCLCSVAASPASIPVPNGNFTSPANMGSVGGGIVGGSGTNVAIGTTGPWTGTYHGALGFLAPPTLTIDSGAATISNIAGINVLGVVNNSGYFSQTLSGLVYEANTAYTLTATIDTGSLLTIGLLSNSGAGIALTNGNDVLASVADPLQILSLNLLSGSTYELALQYITGDIAPTGDLGIRLFDMPTGLLTVDLFETVTFSNIRLDATPIGAEIPEPGAMALTVLGLLGLAGVYRKRRTSRN